jgi:GH15 family glucan-1,4-alpha-glucosidase
LPLAIEDYGLIGDCETAALVGRDGSIDWLCWPAFDSDACFAAILGTNRHGRWLIAPKAEIKKTSRRYWDQTLILETRFETADGTVALTDFMPPRGKASDVVRLVRGVKGRVKMRMQLVIRFGFGVDIPWVKRTEDRSALLAIAGQDHSLHARLWPLASRFARADRSRNRAQGDRGVLEGMVRSLPL